MHRTTAALAIAASFLFGSLALAADAEHPGKELYLRYCGACHGPNGEGDGVAGTFMRPKPIDLTQIAKQHGGAFPARETMAAIDGRDTVRAHGDPDMPVWGELFQDQPTWDTRRRTDVQERIRLITEYIGTIQKR
jgi:mono/diheme cytochrome c family protein